MGGGLIKEFTKIIIAKRIRHPIMPEPKEVIPPIVGVHVGKYGQIHGLALAGVNQARSPLCTPQNDRNLFINGIKLTY
jgi:hypothetical protein